MEVQLFRIDDRLIHGQVILGWAKPLESERILLCDDEISQSEWEKELYLTCVPPNLQTLIFNTGETADFLINQIRENDKTIVLVKDLKSVIDIIGCGYQPAKINLGGIHYNDHRRKFLSYVYLNDEEVKQINWLLDKGIGIYCQDIPSGRKYDAREVLRKAA
jgi:mannose/fructose/N-acetylgalactosamine-specific phosphotransferase system component IIB